MESFWAVNLPPTPWSLAPKTHLLAFFTPCAHTNGQDATSSLVTYEQLTAARFVDVATIEASIGRVRLEIGRDRWAIIDRSGAFASTLIVDDEVPDDS